MGFLDLFTVAVMPVLKVILVTGVGLFLALDRINLLGSEARHHLNNIVFYVLGPALVASNLAETITFESFVTLWFMPVNIFITFIFGSALAWLLIKITKTPRHLQGMVIGCCSAGNMGNLLLIMIPAACEESNNPFGDSSVCSTHAEAYASLSMAVGAIFIWSYVYSVMRMYSAISLNSPRDNSGSETFSESCEGFLPIMDCHSSDDYTAQDELLLNTSAGGKIPIFKRIKMIMGKIDLKKVFAPTAIAAIVGFIIGIVSPIRKLMIGENAPLHVIDTSAYLLGQAAIPCLTLILGANLLRGLKGSNVSISVIVGILAVRNMFLPLLGIGVVKVANRFGMVGSDTLYQFVLMLQYAVPPATAVGTITQFFRLGQSESSVIMLWTYAMASFSLTLWSTLFMWLLA
ncbi:protein PIN-LIKES 3-like [Herrania umbratica]|uniref:Protein PIN-LIKES 3-like n=1 Tax=Herrania umbratica TaxID=108875 RepID=A0A6J1B8U5_9ROSI|nr:protein PIN-LIKES 3-like [Herrania umbratica]XP_021295731.1 protein PIN-LIKES 3-like [Herrania umbratica]